MTSTKLSDKVYLTCVMYRQFCDDSVIHYVSSEILCIREVADLNSCAFPQLKNVKWHGMANIFKNANHYQKILFENKSEMQYCRDPFGCEIDEADVESSLFS